MVRSGLRNADGVLACIDQRSQLPLEDQRLVHEIDRRRPKLLLHVEIAKALEEPTLPGNLVVIQFEIASDQLKPVAVFQRPLPIVSQ